MPSEKPVIVGLYASNRAEFDREVERGDKILAKTPPGIRIGFTITPEEWRRVLRRGPTDVLEAVAKKAAMRGQDVVPIAREPAQVRARKALMEVKKIRELTSPAVDQLGGPIAKLYDSLIDQENQRIHVALRAGVILAAKRAIREKLPVVFTGESHAKFLKPAMHDTHNFDLSPEALKEDLVPKELAGTEVILRLYARDHIRKFRWHLEGR